MRILITGGAGFIGTNAAEYFIPKSKKIYILDNFYRPTSRKNAAYLTQLSPKIKMTEDSVLNKRRMIELVQKVDLVLHLAAQVAVTDSLRNPQLDFETNVVGSINILEAARQFNPRAILIYASTNKVYGDLKKVKMDKQKGVGESAPIDLYSPYGCSKGAADLYWLDYRRSFGLKTVVFRQSCIYGPHQYGIEDQGWLAHFVIQVLKHKPITIYGAGKQIRDLLYIDDLIKLYDTAVKNIDHVMGEAFNIGGGPENALNLLQAIHLIEKTTGNKAVLKYASQRLGDQDYFVADNRKLLKALKWEPTTKVKQGLLKLISWCQINA